jgi:uncharacterized protein (TIGR03437 family)
LLRRFAPCFLFVMLFICGAEAQVITNIAGTSQGLPTPKLPALQAPIGVTGGLAADANGNVFIADNTLRLVYKLTPDGTLSVIAGTGSLGESGDGGPAASASLSGPSGLSLDTSGNLFIADMPGVPFAPFNRIRKVSTDGTITSVACQCVPSDVAVDDTGSGAVYVAVSTSDVVLKITPGSPPVSFGQYFQRAFQAIPRGAQGIAVHNGVVYVSVGATNNFLSYRVYSITPDGKANYVAGNGQITATGDGGSAQVANIGNPAGLAFDAKGNLYIGDIANHVVRKVDTTGTINTVAGNKIPGYSGDGNHAIQASLNHPGRLATDNQGNLYIGDQNNFRVRKVAAADGTISTIAGAGFHNYFGDGGPALMAALNQPQSLVYDSTGALYIADTGNHAIRKVTRDGTIQTLAGNGTMATSGPCNSGALGTPAGVAPDNSGNLYFTDSSLNAICKLTPSGALQIVAGNGKASFGGDGGNPANATLNKPTAIVLDATGVIYFTDSGNNRVRKITPTQISTIAGTGDTHFSGDGGALATTLNSPAGLAIDSAGNLYVSDTGNQRVRKIAMGLITTLIGDGTPGSGGDGGVAVAAEVNQPAGLAVDSSGNLYLTDSLNNRLRRISANGIVTTIAGTGTPGYGGDHGFAPTAQLTHPSGVAFDPAGNIVIADTGNNQVRVVQTSTAIPFPTIPASLSFTTTSGGVPAQPQSLVLASAISGLPFTASVDSPWLALSSNGGLAPASLQVSVDATNLAPGTYKGTVTISVPAANPASGTVAVQFIVQPPLPPQLSVSTQNLSFTVNSGAGPQTARLQISNTGGQTLTYTATAATDTGAQWLSLSPSSGSVLPTAPQAVVATVSPAALTPGTYQGTIRITGGGSIAIVKVSLSINASKPYSLLSQTGLTFTAVSGGGPPLPQTFGILNTGTGVMSWSATASTLSGAAGWLQITPSSGTVMTPFLDVNFVSVSVDPSKLTDGTYYGRIQVTSAAPNSPQSITVVLRVLPVGTRPGMEIRPTGLIFTGTAGSVPSSQDVLVGNAAAQPDSFVTGATNQRGFSYLPTSAALSPGVPTRVTVYPDFTSLKAGEIDRSAITLLRQSDGSSQNISVLIVVAPLSAVSGLAPSAGGCSSNKLEIQWRSPLQNFQAVLGQPMTLEVQVIDDCGNLVGPGGATGATLNATFSNRDSDLRLVHIGNGVWTGTWRPVSAQQGQAIISVTGFNTFGNVLQSGQQSLTGSISAGTAPTVTAGGVVHAASDAAGFPIAPGSLITIYGSNLADAQGVATTLPLPEQQNGAQVLLGDLPLPILYTSSGQLNVQVPFGTPVNTQYQISVQRDNVLSVPEQLVIAAAQPGVFTVNQQGTGQAVVFKSDGVTLAQPGTPATSGETVVLYCTGLGVVTPAVPEGMAPPSNPLSNTVNPVTVTIGGMNAPVQFSGLTPGFPGLYQVNAVVPDGVTGNAVSVVVSVAGQTSPAVTMAIQ